jgi:hypothetical protein
MPSLQEDIQRAGILARLDELVRLLKRNGHLSEWPYAERAWFVAILDPFTIPADAACHLDASSSRGISYGKVMVDALRAHVRQTAALRGQPEKAKLVEEVTSYIKLCQKMIDRRARFSAADDAHALRIANMLRERIVERTSRADRVQAGEQLM